MLYRLYYKGIKSDYNIIINFKLSFIGQEIGYIIHPLIKVIIIKGLKITINRAFKYYNSEFYIITGRKPSL
jgi:hypothetical protein